MVGGCGPASEEPAGVSDPDDPGLIVFTGWTGDGELVHAIRPDGTGLRPIRLGEQCELPDDFSPDGRLAACSSYEPGGGDQRLYVMRLDGSDVRRVPLPVGENSWLSLSPDGSEFVFLNSADIGSDVEALWKARIDGKDAKRLVADGGAADWSPDGKQLAFTGNFDADCGGNLVVMDADGGEQRVILAEEASGVPHWSPDGERIAFLRGDCDNSDIWTVQVDGGSPTFVARDIFELSFAWSLDSKSIAFKRAAAPHGWGFSIQFFVVPATGGKPRPIGPIVSDSPAEVFWLPSSAAPPSPVARGKPRSKTTPGKPSPTVSSPESTG